MKSFFKKLTIFGLVALLVGGVLFTVAFAASGFSFEKLSGLKWDSKSYTESSEINSVTIDVDNADVKVKFDKNAEKITVSYYECKNRNDKILSSVTVTESDGKLTLRESKSWKYDLYLWNYKDTDVILTVPEERMLSLNIFTDNGDAEIYGNPTLGNVRIETDNGDVEFIGTVNAANAQIETDNGDVEISGSFSATALSVETDNGSFEAEGALNLDTISVETDNGRIECEDALITANKIYFMTDNGDVDACLFGAREDYKITVDTDNGDSNVTNQPHGSRELYIETDNGDAYIRFISK